MMRISKESNLLIKSPNNYTTVVHLCRNNRLKIWGYLHPRNINVYLLSHTQINSTDTQQLSAAPSKTLNILIQRMNSNEHSLKSDQ